MPDISVIIPTRNRADFLGLCIDSLCTQNLSAEYYEICIVNNASTDGTPQAVADAIKKYPRHKIILVNEPAIGLSNARNAGVKAASSPLVAMGDDDATMPSDWLERFLSCFTTFGKDLGKVGGEIIPVWSASRPAWMTDAMLPLLSASSGCGDKARFSEDPLLEGNSCYRREALLRAGGFPAQVGRSGNLLLSGDHIVDLIMQLKGWKLYYDPEIVIHHTIHADRLKPDWIRRRYFWQGVSDYAGRMYLKKAGIAVNQALRLDLPLSIGDWAFVNNPDLPPDEAGLLKLHALGLVLAMTGMIPVD